MLCGATVSVWAELKFQSSFSWTSNSPNYLLICDISKYEILTVNTLIFTLITTCTHVQKEEERGESEVS